MEIAAGIIVSLLLVDGYADIARRDFGLLVGAVALFLMASAHDTGDKPAQSW